MMRIWLMVFLFVHSTYSFSNVFITELLGLGYSHGGITGRAIQQISYEYLNVTTEAEFIEKLGYDLWAKHLDAVDLIEKYNDNVDDDPETKDNPMYHFDAERFVRSNNLLITSQELILNSIQNEEYVTAREQIGKYLHTHQDFYSHSNWIEMGGKQAFQSLGEMNAFNGNVATINMSTCLNCRKPCDACEYECANNIIPLLNQEKIFTSGYYVNQSEDGQPVLKPTNVLKCSHGGIIDTTSDIPALGGINKDVKTSLLSPHYYHQESAADAAIESTYLFLKKLWHLTETKNDNTSHFGRLLELVSSQQSLIFIIDLTKSMTNDIERIKILVREMIMNVTSNKTSIPREIGIVAFEKQTFFMIAKPHIDGDINRLLNFLNSLTIQGDRKWTMNEIIQGLSLSNDHCFAYVFTNQLSDDHDRYDEVSVLAKRKHCKINFLLSKENKVDPVMKKIAFETSGIQLDLSNDNLFSILQLITQTNSIPILSSSDFYIDSSVEMIQFVINIKPEYQLPINFDLKILFISPDQSAINFLLNFDSQNMKIGQINQPRIGQWHFRANSSLIESFQIKLITSIHFEHSFQMLHTESTHPGLYSINTEPIQGSSLYSVIRVLSYTSEEIHFSELEFIDSSNNLLKQYNLTKQNDLIYISKIEIPSVDFYIKIQGKNKKNEVIERFYPHEIHPRILELNAIIDSQSSSYLKPGQQARINFTLINHNSKSLSVNVTIRQSPSIFDITLNKHQFLLNSNEIQTNYFELSAPNNLTLIDSSSEISIIAKSPLQSDAFNIFTLRANIISPFNHTEPLRCNSLFPTGKKPNEMCQGSIDSCSSRHWDVYLNITSNLPNSIHSVVLTYYNNQTILHSKKETIKYLPHELNRFDLQLLLSPNDCCKKYADIVVYDRSGNKIHCMDFQQIYF